MARRTTTRGLVAAAAASAALLVPAGPVGAAPTAGAAALPQARIFMVNPVQSTGNQNLTDQRDSPAAVPAYAYTLAGLGNLDASGRLSGRWAYIRSETGAPATVSAAASYNRRDDQFEQVMAYFWVNEAQEYLQGLGFGSELPGANDRRQAVRINQWGRDNSFFTDRRGEIRFGKGGVDDAEDAEVIVHEYGHAVHQAQVPGFGSSPEAGAIGEAFGDYLAVEVGEHAVEAYGWPRRADLACVADWDSVPYSTAPHCLRRVDGDKVYADLEDEVHADGEIWSRALFDIRNALGARTADRIIINAQFDFAPDTSFQNAALTTIATARQMYGDTEADAVQAAFAARQIPGVA
ncbi:M4 family metallopeptidase [Streptomyces sp. ISL-43]|uniref:M4 family metallopeptidase n=1 Tax=Streptomyces sp. ISL-43 TaxID=2819183 RepID=UPI001BEA1448|nr:M4 family metallopeptidase [Streptomyces sp. ISL-43]MBT2447454.1 M4 family metallopeptidase [Streptomyces sp. ISL-43]